VRKDKAAVLQGTLDLLVLKTVGRWVRCMAGDRPTYRAGLRGFAGDEVRDVVSRADTVGADGWIWLEWGSENNRRGRFYSITKQGRKQLTLEAQNWDQMVAFPGRVLGGRR
jgi:PadR family transcriptional regulator, regulatory protein PadR